MVWHQRPAVRAEALGAGNREPGADLCQESPLKGQGADVTKVSDQEPGAGFIRDADREPGGGEGRELRAQASWAADREQGTAELTQGQWRHRLTMGLQRHGPTKGQTRQWPNHEESVYDAGAGGLPGPQTPEPTGHHRGSEQQRLVCWAAGAPLLGSGDEDDLELGTREATCHLGALIS